MGSTLFSASLLRRDRLVAGWVLAIKLLLLVLGATSYRVLQNQELHSWHQWLDIWNRWDALHYLELAQFGYKPPGALRQFAVAYFPLYPWLVRLCSLATQDYLLSAFVVSGFGSIGAAVLLRRLVEQEYQPAVALRAVWFFLVFPTAYFLHIGYAESLFLAVVLGAILAARTDRWWLCGILGALGCLARPTGITLIPTIGAEALHQLWIARRWRWQWLWLLLVPCGFGIYMMLNQWALGDPLAFLRVRKEYFYISFAPPWRGLLNVWGNRLQHGSSGEMVGMQEFIFLMLGLLCTIVSWFRLRPVYAVWMTANWLLFASTSYMQSVPRFTLTLFPMFILFAMLARSRFWRAVITVWSLLFFSFFATHFAWGHWAF